MAGGLIRRQVGLGEGGRPTSRFTIRQGETFGLVGESGCGKTTIGRLMVALERPTAGSVRFEGDELTEPRARRLRRAAATSSSCSRTPTPRSTPACGSGTIVREPLQVQQVGDARRAAGPGGRRCSARSASARRPSTATPTSSPAASASASAWPGRSPSSPKLIVADEPVSALDVSIQAQILNLMKDLQQRHGLTYVMISHDLAVIRYMADTIGVMYLGKLVELGPAAESTRAPAHPYTQGLLDAVPGGRRRRRPTAPSEPNVRGELPSADRPPVGLPVPHPLPAGPGRVRRARSPR